MFRHLTWLICREVNISFNLRRYIFRKLNTKVHQLNENFQRSFNRAKSEVIERVHKVRLNMIVYLQIDMRLPSSKTTKDQQHPSLHEMMHQSIKSIHELTIGIRREKTNCMSFFFIDSLGLTQSMTQIGSMQLNGQSSPKRILSHQSSFASSIFSSGSDSCDSRSSLQIKNRRIKKGGF